MGSSSLSKTLKVFFEVKSKHINKGSYFIILKEINYNRSKSITSQQNIHIEEMNYLYYIESYVKDLFITRNKRLDKNIDKVQNLTK